MPKDPLGQRDIILHTSSNQLQGISVLHRAYDKYVQQLKSAYEFAKGQFPSYKSAINENVRPTCRHRGRYNVPATHDVAILTPNDPVGHRDIVLHTRSNQLSLSPSLSVSLSLSLCLCLSLSLSLYIYIYIYVSIF